MFQSLFNWLGLSKNKNSSAKNDINEQIRQSVENFNNRAIYKKLTTEIIDSTSDDDLLQLIFDNILENFPDDYKKEYETLLTFSKARQAIYMIWCLEAEVNNGGFNQYYFNPSGQFANLTPDALKLIGADKFSDLVIRANYTYESEYSKITEHQDGTLEGFSKSYEDNILNKFDTEFYELSKVEYLHQLQVNFVRNNLTDFI